MKIIKNSHHNNFTFILYDLFSGGGHGTYLLAQIIYPYTMLIAKLQLEFKFFLHIISIDRSSDLWLYLVQQTEMETLHFRNSYGWSFNLFSYKIGSI
jgi:hypothetical protein